jgi:hypothetical protein
VCTSEQASFSRRPFRLHLHLYLYIYCYVIATKGTLPRPWLVRHLRGFEKDSITVSESVLGAQRAIRALSFRLVTEHELPVTVASNPDLADTLDGRCQSGTFVRRIWANNCWPNHGP